MKGKSSERISPSDTSAGKALSNSSPLMALRVSFIAAACDAGVAGVSYGNQRVPRCNVPSYFQQIQDKQFLSADKGYYILLGTAGGPILGG